MKSGLKIDKSAIDAFLKEQKKELKSAPKAVAAGYLTNSVHTDADGHTAPMPEIALFQEYGTERMPARPFLTVASRNLHKRAQAILNAGMEDGKDIDQIATELALTAQSCVKEAILSNIPPPNAESTIRAKGSTKTLVNTGQLLNSVFPAIITKNGEKIV